MSECRICRITLDDGANPLSLDCGGDCLGCIMEVEGRLTNNPISLEDLREELNQQQENSLNAQELLQCIILRNNGYPILIHMDPRTLKQFVLTMGNIPK